MGWVLLYEGECGFCRWSADRILRWDRRRRIRAVPIRSAEGDRLLASLPRRRRLASWHLRGPDGSFASGGSAVAPLLRLLPGGAPLAGLAERFPRTVDRMYGFVARHRDLLGRLAGTRACAVDPASSRAASSRAA